VIPAHAIMVLGRYEHGENQTSIARRFSISQSMVSKIVNHVVWRV